MSENREKENRVTRKSEWESESERVQYVTVIDCIMACISSKGSFASRVVQCEVCLCLLLYFFVLI
jgi:hypothetical protein